MTWHLSFAIPSFLSLGAADAKTIQTETARKYCISRNKKIQVLQRNEKLVSIGRIASMAVPVFVCFQWIFLRNRSLNGMIVSYLQAVLWSVSILYSLPYVNRTTLHHIGSKFIKQRRIAQCQGPKSIEHQQKSRTCSFKIKNRCFQHKKKPADL